LDLDNYQNLQSRQTIKFLIVPLTIKRIKIFKVEPINMDELHHEF